MTGPSPSGDSPPREVTFVEQCSADLAYYLFESLAPRGSVRVLAEREVSLPGAGLTLAIIGSSHFLEIQAGGTVLCEMLACRRPALGRGAACVQGSGEGAWTHQLRRGAIRYRFESWRRLCSESDFRRMTAQLSGSGENRLRYSFPGGSGPGSATTCLEWQLEDRRAIVDTFHTFPGESAIVRSRSVIDVAETGASP